MRRGGLPFFIAFLLVFSSHLLCPRESRCEGIRLVGGFDLRLSDTTTKEKSTGTVTKNETTRFSHRYQLELSKNIYPQLTFRGGGFATFDQSDSTTNGVNSDIDSRTLQPFVELRMNAPLYNAGVTYRNTEVKDTRTNQVTTRGSRDEYAAVLNWRPVGFPRFDATYNRIFTTNEPQTLDKVEDLISLSTRYSWRNLLLHYAYIVNDSEERLSDFKTNRQNHLGKVSYGNVFFDRRLSLDTSYRFEYGTTEFSGEGSGVFPLNRSAGLSSLDDTPEDGPALSFNLALIDGNRQVSAGIDLGLDGDQTTLANIGIDFGFPDTVDTIHLYVDRALPVTVSGSFSWDIYVSSENTDTGSWTLHATVFPAPFGVFENRFEISFPSVETQFIKVVTRPLSSAVTLDPDFRNIFVTEMEAFITISGEVNRFTNKEHTYNLALQGKVSEKTTLGYSLSFRNASSEPPSFERIRWINTADAVHVFNKVFTGSVSLTREDESETLVQMGLQDEKNTVRYEYTASVRAVYLDTLRQRLSYRGTYVEEDFRTGQTNSINLRTSADIYKDWSAFLDLGYIWDRLDETGRRNSKFGRIGSDLVPNKKLRISLNYQVTETEVKNGVEISELSKRGDLLVFFVPTYTLSFSGRWTLQDRERSTVVTQNYSASWNPFPGGELQFLFFYNERLRSSGNQRDTTISPGIRWNISRHFQWEITYNLFESDSDTRNINTESLNTSFTLVF